MELFLWWFHPSKQTDVVAEEVHPKIRCVSWECAIGMCKQQKKKEKNNQANEQTIQNEAAIVIHELWW